MPLLLIVDDEPEFAESLVRLVAPYGEVRVAGTIADALPILETARLAAAMIDQCLPDGSGLDLVAHVRRRLPLLPVLVLTAQMDLSLVNRAQALRAEFAFKPVEPGNIVPFVESALASADGAAARLELAVRRLSEATCMPEREVEVLNLALAGVPRSTMAVELGLAENTLKTVIRRLLERTGEASLLELTYGLFDAALRSS